MNSSASDSGSPTAAMLGATPPDRPSARLLSAAALLAVERQVAHADDIDDVPIRRAAQVAMQASLRDGVYCLSTIERATWAVCQAAATGALYNRRAGNRPGALAAVVAGIHAALFHATDAKRRELAGASRRLGADEAVPEHDLSLHSDSLIAAISRAGGDRAVLTIFELAEQGPVDLAPAWASALRAFRTSQLATRSIAHAAQQCGSAPPETKRS